jgi:hypothetical protein
MEDNLNLALDAIENTCKFYKGRPGLAYFPNANNKGYCRVVLDPISLEIFLSSVDQVQDPADRSYLWRTLADHVHMEKIKPEAFLECVNSKLGSETVELSIQITLEKSLYMLNHFFVG